MKLSGSVEVFVMHFGEMGSRWGFNRTVGQMLALIVISSDSMNADKIAELLGISRGNVSMGLKELQSWRLVKSVRRQGDRKEYFTPAGTIWELARTVFEERCRREMLPTLSLIRSELLSAPANESEAHAYQTMTEIHDLLEMMSQWSDSVSRLNQEQLEGLMKMGAGVTKVLEFKNKLW